MVQDRRAGWRKAFTSSVELRQLVRIRGWGQLSPPLSLETETGPGPIEETESISWLRLPMNVYTEDRFSLRLAHWISLGFRKASLPVPKQNKPKWSRGHAFRIPAPCSVLS